MKQKIYYLSSLLVILNIFIGCSSSASRERSCEDIMGTYSFNAYKSNRELVVREDGRVVNLGLKRVVGRVVKITKRGFTVIGESSMDDDYYIDTTNKLVFYFQDEYDNYDINQSGGYPYKFSKQIKEISR